MLIDFNSLIFGLSIRMVNLEKRDINNEAKFSNFLKKFFEVFKTRIVTLFGDEISTNEDFMDALLKEINENNKAEKVNELRNRIDEYCESIMGEKLQFTDEQLLSIIDIYKNNKNLSFDMIIDDVEIRKLLFDFGFFGNLENNLSEIAPFSRYLVESQQTLSVEDEVKKLEKSLKSRMFNIDSVEESQCVQDILDKTTPYNKEIVDIMLEDKTISNELILNILTSLKTSYKISMLSLFYNPVSIPLFLLQGMVNGAGFTGDLYIRSNLKLNYAYKLLTDSRVLKEMIPSILLYLEKGNSKLVELALKTENFDFKLLPAILKNTLTDSIYYINDKKTPSNSRVKFAISLINNPRIPNEYISDILYVYDIDNVNNKFVVSLCNDPSFPPSQIAPLIRNISHDENGMGYLFNLREPKFKQRLAERLVVDKNCPNECISDIINYIISRQERLFDQLYLDENIPIEELGSILFLERALNTDYRKFTFFSKILVLTNIVIIEEKTWDYLKAYGIDRYKVKDLVDAISLELGIKKESIPTTDENKKILFRNFITNKSTVEEMVKNMNLDEYKNGIPLKYSRSKFIKDIDDILKELGSADRKIVLNYFGLQIENGVMEGFPIIPKQSFLMKDELLYIIEQIKIKIVEFTQDNETSITNPELKQFFDSLIKGCPEFTTIIGKVQHKNHKYTVDIHTLKVLQNIFDDLEYQRLDDESKTVLKFVVLLHDLGKKEGVIDKNHCETGAKYAVSILEKYNLSPRVKSRIIEMINNHHWFEFYNKNEISANMVNVMFRTPSDLQMAILFAKADLMGVNDDFHFKITKTHNIRNFEDFFAKERNELFFQQHSRYMDSNLVMNSKFIQTDVRKFPLQSVEIEGQTLEIPVLNLTDESMSDDLFEFGFAKGVTRKSVRFFSHFNDKIEGLKIFIALSSSPTVESVQSLSMISLGNSKSYRNQKYGVIVDADMSSIAQASCGNISSGHKKDLKNFSRDLFGFFHVNTFVKDHFMRILRESSINLTKKEYGQLAEKIVGSQYETQINEDIKIGDKVVPAKLLQDALIISRDKLFDGNFHNEIVAINPRVTALVARVSSIEECSTDFLKLAVEYKLPIILIGHNE